MIIEVPVICALAFHVLFNIRKQPLPFHKLPVEQFQLSSCPFYTVPASIHLDLPCFRQREPCLAEPEGFCQGNDFAFAFVHPYSSGFKPPKETFTVAHLMKIMLFAFRLHF